MVGVARTPAHCGEVGCVGGRRDVAERGMRSALIVVSDPAGNRLARMIETEEQALVEKFVAHAAVEALAESVLHRLPRRDEMPDDPVILRPAEHGVRRELSSVVRDDHAGFAASLDQRRQLARHASAGNRDVGDRRQALPRHVVDDVQDAEAATAGELVVDKIQRPAGVGRRLDQDRRPRSCGAPTRPTLADRKALFAIEAIDAVDPRGLAILPQ